MSQPEVVEIEAIQISSKESSKSSNKYISREKFDSNLVILNDSLPETSTILDHGISLDKF